MADVKIEGFDSIIAEAVNQRVAVAIAEALKGDQVRLVERFVDAALSAKTKDGYRELPFIEKVAKDTIQEVTKQEVAKWAESIRPAITDELERQLGTKKMQREIATGLVGSFMKATSSAWNIKVTISEPPTD